MVASCSPRRYSLPSGVVKSMRRSTASSRVSWPPMTLVQVGAVASSKSAIQTLAPEFRALTAIRRSGGPVISTRRSVRPGAGGATRQCGSSRRARVASGKSSGVPPARWPERRRRSLRTSRRRSANAVSSRPMNSRASGVRISSWRSPGAPRTWTLLVRDGRGMRFSSAGAGVGARGKVPRAPVGKGPAGRAGRRRCGSCPSVAQWNCSSSVEPESAVVEEAGLTAVETRSK